VDIKQELVEESNEYCIQDEQDPTGGALGFKKSEYVDGLRVDAALQVKRLELHGDESASELYAVLQRPEVH